MASITAEAPRQIPEFKVADVNDVIRIDGILKRGGFSSIGETLVNWGHRRQEVSVSQNSFRVRMKLEVISEKRL